MALALYELDSEYASLAETEAFTEPEEAPLDDRLAALAAELEPKLLALAKVVLTLNAEAELLEQQGRSLLSRADRRRQRADYLKRWIGLQMQGVALDRLRNPFVTLWLQQSPGAVEVTDEAAVPPEFKRVTLRLPLSLVPPGLLGLVQTCDVDRATLQELLKRTGELPAGVAYRRGQKHLRIR